MDLLQTPENKPETTLIPTEPATLILPTQTRPDRNPVLVYLGKLTSPHSKRNMGRALDTMADLLTGGLPDQRGKQQSGAKAALLGAAWGELRYPHTAKLRADLTGLFSVSTANTCLSALRGVLKEAWRLGYLTAEDYQRAIDIPNVKAETLPSTPSPRTNATPSCCSTASAAPRRWG